MEEQQYHQSVHFGQLHNFCIIKVHARTANTIANFAGMRVSLDQIRGAQVKLNCQFNSATVQCLLYEQTASTSGPVNPKL